MWFPNRSDTNRALQAQEINFESRTKVLIYAFVFAYAKCCFCHDETHICLCISKNRFLYGGGIFASNSKAMAIW